MDQLGDQIQSLAANLYTVFNQIENLKNVGVLTSDLNILHVSDIHNHPVAYDFIGQVVATFPIDVIIDTGDLTDWGTPLEAEMSARLSNSCDLSFAAGIMKLQMFWQGWSKPVMCCCSGLIQWR